MPNYKILETEINTDPLGRGYSGMTNQEIVDSLNAIDRDKWVPLSSADIFEAIDPTEFSGLTNALEARADRILGIGSGISTTPGSNARSELIAIFGGGSTTISNLASIANQQVSRGVEIGWGTVTLNDLSRLVGL